MNNATIKKIGEDHIIRQQAVGISIRVKVPPNSTGIQQTQFYFLH